MVQATINIAPPGALRIASTAGQASHMHTSTRPTLLKVSEASHRWPSQIAGAKRIDKPRLSNTTPKIKAIHLGSEFPDWLISKLPAIEAIVGQSQAMGLLRVAMSPNLRFEAVDYSRFAEFALRTRRCYGRSH